jgi:cell shape-determining protein MreC
MKNFSSKTKKSYLRNSSKHTVRTALILTVGAVIIVFFLRGFIGSIFSDVVSSVLSVRTYFGTSSATLPSYVRNRSELFSEIQDLKETIGAQSGSAAIIERLTRENTEFRALLGDNTEERIGAGVIARPPYVPYDVLVLDRGSEDGIKEGALVYHTSDFVIGYVQNTFKKSAVVALFSSPNVESTVYVYGPDVYATAYGEGGGVIRISVPQGVPIAEGNVVILPMLNTGTLGTVQGVTSVPTQPEQHAYLSFPTSMQSIRLVSVERSPIEEVSFEDAALNVGAYRGKFILDVPAELRLSVGTSTASTTENNTSAGSTSVTE